MRDHFDTIIHADTIITQNKDREILSKHALAIKNGIIRAIAPSAHIKNLWSANAILEFPDHILMPGLINSHTHAAMTFCRSLGDDLHLMDWLSSHIFPLEKRLTSEITELGSMLGYAEMLASGTTSCIDMYIFENAVFSAAEKTGIRCMGGEAIFGFPSAAFLHYGKALEMTASLAEKYKYSSRIKIAINPHSVYTTTPDILRACREIAASLNLPVHIHLAESRKETEMCLAKYGKRPISWCEQNGLFDCPVIAAHMVDVLPEEISFLKTVNIVPVHNPASNMKLASGVSPVREMLGEELPVALGTDGPASNNSLNMFAEMKLAALLQKVSNLDATALTCQEALDMATIHGAKAFGDNYTGSIEQGKQADCIALDKSKPNMFPCINPVSQIVYSATGNECEMTMVNGEIVYKDGKFTRFDYPLLLKELDKLRSFIIEH